MLSKAAILCLDSNLFLRWELFNRNSATNTPQERKLNSEYYKLRKSLRKNPTQFFEYFNMSVEVYDYIYNHVKDRLDASVISIKALSSGEKLFITLRYLAKGMTMREISQSFLIGTSTASKVINFTVTTIWEIFQPIHLAPPNLAQFKQLAQDYHHKWRFPNCVGAIGGKYVAMNRSRKRQLLYKRCEIRKLKKTSLVIHAVADSEFRFQAIRVTAAKEEPDFTFGNTFLYLGCSAPPGETNKLPLVMIGNQAFPLKRYLLRPYPPRAVSICASKANYNKRLEAARITIDCAFEIMTEKWQILKRPLEVSRNLAIMTVQVACLLNNIIKDVDGMTDPHFCKFGQKDHGAIYLDLLKRHPKRVNNRANAIAVQIREQFEKYLMDHDE